MKKAIIRVFIRKNNYRNWYKERLTRSFLHALKHIVLSHGRVDIKGYATQPWDLYIKDQTSHDGKVVGFQHPYEPISYHGEAGYYKIATQNMEKKINYTGPEHAVLVVVAYPKDKVSANESLKTVSSYCTSM